MKLSLHTILLLFALIFASKVYADDVTCDHDDQDYEMEFLDVEEEISPSHDEEGRMLKSRTDYPHLRIYAYYDILKKTAPSSYVSYVRNELAPPVIAYFQAALRVKYPVSGKLKLGSSVRSICGKTTPSILKSGVSADYVMLFDSKSEDNSVVASSRSCYSASGTKRPLIATTSFNRQQMKEARGNVLLHEKNMYLLIHEMMHTFGFSKNSYPYFLDQNGRTRKGHIKSVSIAGKKRRVIDVAPLTQKLRSFYGCSSIPGAIMENDGGSGTADSHFERKLYVYETMSSGGIYGRRVSEFSLALLEGSGWYYPDYAYAEPFFYGKGQGCGFMNNKCSSSRAIFQEFCTGSSRSCAPQGRSGGKCGSDSKADGCRYVEPDVDYDCENTDAEDNARLPSLEVYGRSAGSKCFSGDLNTRKSSSGNTSFCFKYSCKGSGSSAVLEVILGSKVVKCTRKGKVPVSGYYGGINCPDPSDFCATAGKKYCPRGCMGRGSCVNSKCVCKSGYKGIDCGLRA